MRSGVYTGIGQEAIIVGTCFALRKEDFICPLHRDLGSFLMKGVEPRAMMSQMFGKATGLSKGRDSALHSGVSELGIFGNTSMLGANLPVAAGLGADLQDGEDRQRRRRLLRRGREQHRRFPRGAELRRRPAAADRLRLREQSVRVLGAGREEHGDRRRGRSGGELRLRRRGRSTATTCWRSISRPRARSRGRAAARGRRSSSARRTGGTATPSTTRRSIGPTKSWRCGRAAIRFRRSRPTCRRGNVLTDGQAEGNRRARRRRRSTMRSSLR